MRESRRWKKSRADPRISTRIEAEAPGRRVSSLPRLLQPARKRSLAPPLRISCTAAPGPPKVLPVAVYELTGLLLSLASSTALSEHGALPVIISRAAPALPIQYRVLR